MSKNNSKQWIPEIVYEEGEGQLPFIHVPPGEEDPKLLFIFISRQTGEFEPGPEGEDIPVTEMDLRQFVDLSLLILVASTADILNDIASQKIQLLIHNKIPNLDTTTLVVRWVVLSRPV